MRKAALALIAVSLMFAGPAWGADAATAMTKANASYIKGDYVETIAGLREALVDVWNKAPLTVQNICFVTEQPEAYGMYTPRTEAAFDAVDPILLYCEPVGYTVVKSGDFYSFAVAADFSVVDEKGQVLGGQQNFGSWDMKGRAFNTEFMMYFTFNLKGLPSGNYKLQVTLHDRNSDKKTSFEQPFAIR